MRKKFFFFNLETVKVKRRNTVTVHELKFNWVSNGSGLNSSEITNPFPEI